MSSLLLRLPDDILISIFLLLPVEALLILQQTCRVLHRFCTTDYIWHNIKIDQPLDVPVHIDPNTLSGLRIKKLCIQALRVEHNWKAPFSQVKGVHRVYHGDIPFQTTYLSDWLVILSRPSTATTCTLSVWNVRDPSKAKRERSILLENTQKARFTASLSDDGLEATIAVYGTANRADKEPIRVYIVPLYGDFPPASYAQPKCALKKENVDGYVYGISICGEVLGAILAKLVDSFTPPTFRIMFLNIRTGAHVLVDQSGQANRLGAPFLQVFSAQLRLRVFQNYFLLIGTGSGADSRLLGLEMYSISPVLSKLNAFTQGRDVLRLGDPLMQYFPLSIPVHGFEHKISAMVTGPYLRSISSVCFPPPYTSNVGYVVRFPLPSPNQLKPSPEHNTVVHKFATSGSSWGVELIEIGQTGRRVIWLQRHLETDQFAFMKATFPLDQEPVVGPLLPSHMVFPFEAHTCQSIALDEATGRVCLAFHTGEMYLLDL
ncbi:hypothetical protein K435DRAFT_959979 [Dendrothele bispora CBS 962.96]|uniref:F-box domain-containing protein n=1 Tax=Dendrothele bispora (strain CBS 962.96) TaxID=1314807 RepID=A0A4S8MWA9_DENBC|nr:hypothetical protein K435DRAFT_959979 [Dendrothele bispora CBS 962.96]